MSSLCFCFGSALKQFSNDTFLSMFDVMRHFLYIKRQTKNYCDTRKKVTQDIKDHFIKNNGNREIVISDKVINDNIKKCWETREKLKKNKKTNQRQVIQFRAICRDNIVDIGRCKCKGVPCCHSRKKNPHLLLIKKEIESDFVYSDSEVEQERPDLDDREYVPVKSERNTVNLTLAAEVADRYHASDRAAAAIATAVLVDVGLINESDKKLVIDKSKMQRARVKKRQWEEANVSFDGQALFFDGRKDNTLKQRKINGI